MVQTPPSSPQGTGPNRLFWFVVVAVGLTGLVVWLANRYPNALDSRETMINITRYGAILLLVASGILGSRTLNVKKAVRDIAIWIAIIAGLVALYGFRYELETLALRVAGELEPARGNESVGGEMLVTADHGNAEQMQDETTGQAHTAHTSNPVPLVYIGRPAQMSEHGALSDIGPSMLYLMNMEIPPEMTGTPLVSLLPDEVASIEPVTNVELHG